MRSTKGPKSILELQHLSEARLLMHLAWPVVISLFVQGFYGLVDSMYLSRLGEQVLSATSLALVLQNLQSAIFTGIATGMNAVISRSLGAGDFERSRGAVVCGCAVQGIFVAIFMLFGIFGAEPYFKLSTTDTAVIEYGIAYLQPTFLLCIAAAAQVTFERLLQSSGIMLYMLISQAVGSLVNIVLDPIMIFGYLGCPAMGVTGAAYATAIGQGVAALLALYFNIRKNGLLFERLLQKGRLCWKLIGEICRIGIPSAAMGITSSIGSYCINRLLIASSATANAAFGVYIKLERVGLVPASGLSAGLVTMIAFFLGKRDQERIRKTVKWGLIYIGIWSTVCASLFVFIPELLFSPFHPTEHMLEVGLPAFRIVGSTFLLSGYSVVFNSYLQAVGHSVFSLLISLSRQVLVRMPAAILLSKLGNIMLIWLSWPISEIVSDTVCVIFFLIVYRKIANELQKNAFPTEVVS